MNRCLHCHKPCSAHAIFCETCRDSLLVRHASLSLTEQASSPTPSIESEESDYATQAIEPSLPAFVKLSGLKRLPLHMRLMLITFAIIAILSFTVDAILLVINSQRHHQNIVPATFNASTTTPSAYATPLAPIRGHGSTTEQGAPMTPSAGTTPAAGTNNPMLQLSAAQLTFHYIQGNAQPAGQSVLLQSSDANAFSWRIQGSSVPTWLSVEPLQGAVSAKSSGIIVMSVQVSQLPPGTYTGALSISGTNAAGRPLQNSPQTLTVTVLVQLPCTLQAAPATLTFTSSLLQPNPPGQTITVKASGSCATPVSWTTSVDASWVQLSSSAGVDTGSGSSISVTIHSRGMLVGTYTAHITPIATDSNGAAIPVNPQSITVTLNVTA